MFICQVIVNQIFNIRPDYGVIPCKKFYCYERVHGRYSKFFQKRVVFVCSRRHDRVADFPFSTTLIVTFIYKFFATSDNHYLEFL